MSPLPSLQSRHAPLSHLLYTQTKLTHPQGVNDYTTNQYTLHTAPGCTLQPASFTGTALSSLPQSCAVAETGGTGCPIRDASPKSYGAGFNAAGGGAYAMRWAEDGIAMWFWPRGALPSDIEDGGEPRPEGWGEPAAMFGAGGCAPFEYFAKQSVILDTALWCVVSFGGGGWELGLTWWAGGGIVGRSRMRCGRLRAARRGRRSRVRHARGMRAASSMCGRKGRHSGRLVSTRVVSAFAARLTALGLA